MCKYVHVEILSKMLENGIQPHGKVQYIKQHGCHFKHNSQVSKYISQYYQSTNSLIICSYSLSMNLWKVDLATEGHYNEQNK